MERKKSGIFLISDPLRKGACFEVQPPAIMAARRALRACDKNPAPSQIFLCSPVYLLPFGAEARTCAAGQRRQKCGINWFRKEVPDTIYPVNWTSRDNQSRPFNREGFSLHSPKKDASISRRRRSTKCRDHGAYPKLAAHGYEAKPAHLLTSCLLNGVLPV